MIVTVALGDKWVMPALPQVHFRWLGRQFENRSNRMSLPFFPQAGFPWTSKQTFFCLLLPNGKVLCCTTTAHLIKCASLCLTPFMARSFAKPQAGQWSCSFPPLPQVHQTSRQSTITHYSLTPSPSVHITRAHFFFTLTFTQFKMVFTASFKFWSRDK